MFSSNPQDRTVLGPGTTTVARLNPNVSTDKVSLGGKLEPNQEGNFVYPESDDRFTSAAAFSSVANAVAATEASWGESIQWASLTLAKI